MDASERLAIDLIASEAALVDQIEFDALALGRAGAASAVANGERVLSLLRALLDRGAIPGHRLRVFTDADHHPRGGKRSHKQIFQGNGTSGDDIARHPHFLKVIRYFLLGPDLPQAAIAGFARAVSDAGGGIGGSESIEVSKAARHLVRTHGLEPHHASEEFFKLALEHGAHPMWASAIYASVRTVRPGR